MHGLPLMYHGKLHSIASIIIPRTSDLSNAVAVTSVVFGPRNIPARIAFKAKCYKSNNEIWNITGLYSRKAASRFTANLSSTVGFAIVTALLYFLTSGPGLLGKDHRLREKKSKDDKQSLPSSQASIFRRGLSLLGSRGANENVCPGTNKMNWTWRAGEKAVQELIKSLSFQPGIVEQK